MFWKRDFMIFVSFAQSVTFYALKRNTFAISEKVRNFALKIINFVMGKLTFPAFPKSTRAVLNYWFLQCQNWYFELG